MQIRIARYSFSGDAGEIARIAEERFAPSFQSMPGFKGYTIFATADDLFSISVWETEEQAHAADAASRQWNAENVADRIQSKDTQIGEILFSTVFGVSTLAGARA
jgi:heme-degrading monooxygenase HmoA